MFNVNFRVWYCNWELMMYGLFRIHKDGRKPYVVTLCPVVIDIQNIEKTDWKQEYGHCFSGEIMPTVGMNDTTTEEEMKSILNEEQDGEGIDGFKGVPIYDKDLITGMTKEQK